MTEGNVWVLNVETSKPVPSFTYQYSIVRENVIVRQETTYHTMKVPSAENSVTQQDSWDIGAKVLIIVVNLV